MQMHSLRSFHFEQIRAIQVVENFFGIVRNINFSTLRMKSLINENGLKIICNTLNISAHLKMSIYLTFAQYLHSVNVPCRSDYVFYKRFQLKFKSKLKAM